MEVYRLEQVSGREVFEFRPELVDDDDEEADDTKYAEEDDELTEEVGEEEDCQDIDVARFVLKEVDDTGITVAAADRFSSRVQPNGGRDDNKLSEASGGVENGEDHTLEEDGTSTNSDGGEEAESEAVPVDENLFTGEDLDELEEELNTLDLDE
ncbi:zinc finger CCCH domain-containing protein 15 [Silurus asotus]|uniref:Zinc finger CCCH domain-containing protein 15 n=1 Tax=Silurus asotus TaxID=30991 RepID=A0AAD5B524_SILAS|nr:zinc finger CCCH domain-containing protein 15 [Silurus asotus]